MDKEIWTIGEGVEVVPNKNAMESEIYYSVVNAEKDERILVGMTVIETLEFMNKLAESIQKALEELMK